MSGHTGVRPFGAAVVAALALGVAAGPGVHGDAPEDCLPRIRRIVWGSSPAPDEIRNSPQWQAVPRDEFEAEWNEAASCGQAAPPQLIEARHEAALVDGRLIGRSSMKIAHRRQRPALFRLHPWEQGIVPASARLNNGEALLGNWDRVLAVWLPGPGTHHLEFSWTARVLPAPGALTWQLQTPSPPVSVLELLLPNDFTVAFPDTGELRAVAQASRSGDLPQTRRWQIAFGGRTRLTVKLQRRGGSEASEGTKDILEVRTQTHYRLPSTGEDADVRVELECHVLSGRIHQLEIDAPKGLRPVRIVQHSGPQRELEWREQERGEGRRLVVSLTEPSDSRVVVEIFGRAEKFLTPPGGRVRFPTYRVINAWSRGERLIIDAAADWALMDWDFGSFRPEAPMSLQSEGDQLWERLLLGKSGVDDPGRQLRPSAAIGGTAADLAVRQESWLSAAADHLNLSTRLHWQVRSGRVERLRVRLPENWTLEDLAVGPGKGTREWEVRREGGGRVVVAEYLRGGLGQGATVTMTLNLRRAVGGSDEFSLPLVGPLDVRWLEGSLAIGPARNGAGGRSHYTELLDFPGRAAPPPAAADALWHGRQLDSFHVYHGQAVGGRLRLTPVAPEVELFAVLELLPTDKALRARYTLTLAAAKGAPTEIMIGYTSPIAAPRWRIVSGRGELHPDDQLRELDLHKLGTPATMPFVAPAVAGALSRLKAELRAETPANDPRRAWPIRFASPLDGTLTLRSEFFTISDPSRVPLAYLACVGRFAGRVWWTGPAADADRLERQGLSPLWPDAANNENFPPNVTRAFAYFDSHASLGLAGEAGADAQAIVETACVTHSLDADGKVRSRYRFLLRPSRTRTAELRLPPETELESVVAARGNEPLWKRTPDGLAFISQSEPLVGEIVYSRAAAGWAGLQRLPAALPQWQPPVEVIETRCYWRLPAELAPVAATGRLRSTSGGGGPSDSLLNAVIRFTRAAISQKHNVERDVYYPYAKRDAYFTGDAGDGPSAAEMVRREWEEWRRAARRMPFEAFLQQLLQRAGGDKAPAVVIDTAAMAWEDGASPGHSARWLGTDIDDLVLVCCRNAVVVTTAAALAGAGAGSEEEFDRLYAASVMQAAALGRDASGRFCDLSEAARFARLGFAADHAAWLHLAPDALAANVWEDADVESDLWCIRAETSHLAGVIVALAVLLIGRWLGRKGWENGRPAAAFVFAAAAAISASVAMQWLPAVMQPMAWWMLGAAAAVFVVPALVNYFRLKADLRAAPAGASGAGGFRAGAGLLVLSVIGLGGTQAATKNAIEPVTVYLAAAGEDRPFEQVVWMPVDTWKKIRARAEFSRRGAPQHALLDAHYEINLPPGGNEPEALATVTLHAVFHVHLMTDGPVSVGFPIGQGRLRNAQLDGLPVLTTPLAQPAGVAVSIKGRGRHQVRLSFDVPRDHQAGITRLRTPIPVAAAARLQLSLPEGAADVQAVGAGGGQWFEPAGGKVLFKADLGGAAELLVRWAEGADAEPAAVRVVQMHWWELRPQAVDLRCVFHYDAAKAAIRRFRCRIPPHFDLRSVALKNLAEQGPALRIRDWRLRERSGWIELEVTPDFPASGQTRLYLELAYRVPRAEAWTAARLADSWTQIVHPSPGAGSGSILTEALAQGVARSRCLTLPLPGPLGAEDGGGWVLMQARGVSLEKLQPGQGMSAAAIDELLADWPVELLPPGADRRQIAEDVRGGFRFPGGAVAGCQAVVRPSAPLFHIEQETVLGLGLSEIEIKAQARIQVAAGSLTFLEWRLPADVQVAEIEGADVLRWRRQASGVLIWLRRAVGDATTVTLVGRLPTRRGLSGDFRASWPRLRLSGGQYRLVRYDLQRRDAVGFQVLPAAPAGLHRLPAVDARENLLASYQASNPEHGGTLLLFPVRPRMEVRTTTRIDGSADAPRFATTVECRPLDAPASAVVFRIDSSLIDGGVGIEGDTVIRARKVRRTEQFEEWLVELSPSAGPFPRFVVHGKLRATGPGRYQLPRLDVPAAERCVRMLADSAGVAWTGDSGVVPPAGDGVPATWPAGKTFWLPAPAVIPGAFLRLPFEMPVQPAFDWTPPATASASLRLFDASCRSRAAGKHLVHEAEYLVWHEAGADMPIELPANAILLACGMDGREFPRPSPAGRVVIPLPLQAGARRVHLRWATPWDGAKVTFSAPVIVAADSGQPVDWVFHQTVGLAAQTRRGETGVDAAALHQLRRAEAFLQLATTLHQRPRPSEPGIAAALREFYERLAAVAQRVVFAGRHADRSTATRLAELSERARSQFRDGKWATLRQQAEEAAARFAADAPAAEGSPTENAVWVRWLDQWPQGMPIFRLALPSGSETSPTAGRGQELVVEVIAARHRDKAAGTTLAYLLVAVGGLLTWRFGRVRATAARLAPECLTGAGLLWWMTLPAATPGLALVAAGVLLRLHWTATAIRAVLGRRHVRPDF